jgi:hypothetical protein
MNGLMKMMPLHDGAYYWTARLPLKFLPIVIWLDSVAIDGESLTGWTG